MPKVDRKGDNLKGTGIRLNDTDNSTGQVAIIGSKQHTGDKWERSKNVGDSRRRKGKDTGTATQGKPRDRRVKLAESVTIYKQELQKANEGKEGYQSFGRNEIWRWRR